jgi:hypothetical protein
MIADWNNYNDYNYGTDQRFLRERIWPDVIEDHISHGRSYKEGRDKHTRPLTNPILTAGGYIGAKIKRIDDDLAYCKRIYGWPAHI